MYDTLFGTDKKTRVRLQMVDKRSVSPDQRLWSFTLRPGLQFHDGATIPGEDVIASSRAGASAIRATSTGT
jgi:peptide/nickel transport system substrate-binding protein